MYSSSLFIKLASVLALFFGYQNALFAGHAHVHGKAELTIIAERNSLAVNAQIPAESLFGFEHHARSTTEKEKVFSVKKRLSRQDNVIHLKGGDCQLKTLDIDTGSIMPDHPEKNSTTHDLSHSHQQLHAEVILNYAFECNSPDDVDSMSLTLFEHFDGIEQVHARWATSKKQGTVMLNKKNNEIYFN